MGDIREDDFKSPEAFKVMQKHFQKLALKVRRVTEENQRLKKFRESIEKLGETGLLSQEAVKTVQVNINN